VETDLPRLNGEVHPAYANPRPEVTALVPSWATRVLDVGCSVGIMGASLRDRGHKVTGIEYNAELAAGARGRLECVIEADVETLARDGVDVGGPFECVCFADVLEHLRNPWAVIKWAESLLIDGGIVIVSVPNISRLETFWHVFVKRRWPYLPFGVFDRTHLRWFARRNLPELFQGTSLQITEVRRVFVLSLNPASKWNRIASWFGDLGTLQFLVRADRS
jgi:2-polyprenyl-3-methyl-5-hydroxy-6-metoxy-1,4-benzoquinol methylase